MEDGTSLPLIDHQLSLFDVIAKRRQTAHPHAFFLGRRDLVADALAGEFAFKLGKG